MEISNHLKNILEEGGYEISVHDAGFQISKMNRSSWLSTVFSLAVGFAVLFLAFQLASIWLGLFGVVLFGWPLIKGNWNYPERVLINPENGLLTYQGILWNRVYPISELTSIEVDERIVGSDVSPFKEGYRDYFYNFFLYNKSGKMKFLQLGYRSEQSGQLGDLVKWLSKMLKIS